MTEIATYLLIAIVKLLGTNYEEIDFYSYMDQEKNIDLFTKINLKYDNVITTAKVGIGFKSAGDLIKPGTKCNIYVPSPSWKTKYFVMRFEDFNNNKKYYYKFDGDGLRYELAEFITMINRRNIGYKLTPSKSITINSIIEDFIAGNWC